MPRVQLVVPERIVTAFRARGRNASDAGRRIAERYLDMIDEGMESANRSLSPDDGAAILAAVGDAELEPWRATTLAFYVGDATPEAADLQARLLAMSQLEVYAIMDAIERFRLAELHGIPLDPRLVMGARA